VDELPAARRGAIDCAMKGPAGFDVLDSPWAEVKLGAKFWYAKGRRWCG
jgi:hypothetical protein